MDDFDVDLGDGVLYPLLSSPESSLNVADRRCQVGDNHTSKGLTLLVNEDLPLHEKQRLVVERVLNGGGEQQSGAQEAEKPYLFKRVGGSSYIGKKIMRSTATGTSC
jgi:hypothetical protein